MPHHLRKFESMIESYAQTILRHVNELLPGNTPQNASLSAVGLLDNLASINANKIGHEDAGGLLFLDKFDLWPTLQFNKNENLKKKNLFLSVLLRKFRAMKINIANSLRVCVCVRVTLCSDNN